MTSYDILSHFAHYSLGDMVQSVFGHRGIVTCVSFSPEHGLHGNKGDGLIGSGSQDTTVLLWKWSGKLNRVTGPLSKLEGKLLYKPK